MALLEFIDIVTLPHSFEWCKTFGIHDWQNFDEIYG